MNVKIRLFEVSFLGSSLLVHFFDKTTADFFCSRYLNAFVQEIQVNVRRVLIEDNDCSKLDALKAAVNTGLVPLWADGQVYDVQTLDEKKEETSQGTLLTERHPISLEPLLERLSASFNEDNNAFPLLYFQAQQIFKNQTESSTCFDDIDCWELLFDAKYVLQVEAYALHTTNFRLDDQSHRPKIIHYSSIGFDNVKTNLFAVIWGEKNEYFLCRKSKEITQWLIESGADLTDFDLDRLMKIIDSSMEYCHETSS